MEISTETAWRKVFSFGKRSVPYHKLKHIYAHYPDLLAAAREIEYERLAYADDKEIEVTKKIFSKLYKKMIWQ